MTSETERLCDIMRQGFMKPRKGRKAPKPAPPTVACDDCLNWHPKGRHTADKGTRAARCKERGTPNTQREIGK